MAFSEFSNLNRTIMKNLQEILKQEPVYLENWSEDKKIGLISDKALKRWNNVNILFAYYSYEHYSGEAFVLFHQDGKLFEVNAFHCSYNGLEYQFEPEETTLKELEYKLVIGTMGEGKYSKELKEFLGIN